MKHILLAVSLLSLIGCSNSANQNPEDTSRDDEQTIEVSALQAGGLDVLPATLPIFATTSTVTDASLSLTLKNNGATPFAFQSTAVVGSGYTLKTNRCTATLAPKASCSMTISFSSRSIYDGDYNAELKLNSTVSLQLVGKVSGKPDPSKTGAAKLEMTLSSPFSPLGPTPTRDLTIKNVGTGNAKDVAVGMPPEYSIVVNRCPSVLKPLESCSVKVMLKDYRNTTTPPPEAVVTVTSPSIPAPTQIGTVSNSVVCSTNGQTVAEGATITTFSASSVPFGSSCQSVKQVSTCHSSVLTPAVFSNLTCAETPAAKCLYNGQNIDNGQQVTTYVQSTNSCVATVSTCNNGTFDVPPQPDSTCSVMPANPCTFGSQTVAHGNTIQSYSSASVSFGLTCDSVKFTSTCDNGTFVPATGQATCGVQSVGTSVSPSTLELLLSPIDRNHDYVSIVGSSAYAGKAVEVVLNRTYQNNPKDVVASTFSPLVNNGVNPATNTSPIEVQELFPSSIQKISGQSSNTVSSCYVTPTANPCFTSGNSFNFEFTTSTLSSLYSVNLNINNSPIPLTINRHFVQRQSDFNSNSSDNIAFTTPKFGNAYYIAIEGRLIRIPAGGLPQRVTDASIQVKNILESGPDGIYFVGCNTSGSACRLMKYVPSSNPEAYVFGTITSISRIRFASDSIFKLASFNGKMYFSAFDTIGNVIRLFCYNPNDNTVKIVFYGPLGMDFNNSTVSSNKLYFSNQSSNGSKIYSVDLNDNVKQEVNIYPQGSDSISLLRMFNNELYFMAANDSDGLNQLFKLNASGVVTKLSNIQGSDINSFTNAVEYNSELYMRVIIYPTGSLSKGGIYKIDTTGSLKEVIPLSSDYYLSEGLAFHKSELYFGKKTAVDAYGGFVFKLHKYNPVTGKVFRLNDIRESNKNDDPRPLFSQLNDLFFIGADRGAVVTDFGISYEMTYEKLFSINVQ